MCLQTFTSNDTAPKPDFNHSQHSFASLPLIKKCIFLNECTEHFIFGETSNQGFNMHTARHCADGCRWRRLACSGVRGTRLFEAKTDAVKREYSYRCSIKTNASPDYESGGQEFESLRARQQHIDNTTYCQSRKSTCFPSPVYIATMSPRL
jgi:hypothetical protein